jgi:hypothetical protein
VGECFGFCYVSAKNNPKPLKQGALTDTTNSPILSQKSL